MRRFDQVAGFILAGGASSRMGRDKALLEIGGKTLIERTARLLEPLVAGVTVIGSPQRHAALGVPVVPDDAAGLGPLGGIATALRITSAPWNLILGCDLPYLTAEWIEWLIRRAMRSHAEVLVPETQRGLEPLCAVYRAGSGPAIAAALAAGVRKVTDALAALEIERALPEQWKALDPGGTLFRNVNTPADYTEARTQLEGKNNRRASARQKKS